MAISGELSASPMNKLSVKRHIFIGLFLSYIVDAFDFAILALALPGIIKTFNLSMLEAGLLGTATLIGVAISAVSIGYISDTYGRKVTLLWCLVTISLMTGAIALASSWTQMMVMRLLAGIGLGGVWGIMVSYVKETFSEKHRARAAGMIVSSWPVGFILSAFLAGILIPQFGWRSLFVFGLAGLISAFYVLIFVPESPEWLEQRAKRLTKTSRSGNVSISEIFTHQLLSRTIFATLAAGFGLTAYWGINTWVPTFLVKVYGMEMSKVSTFMVMMNVGMFAGFFLFGYIADRFGRKLAIMICLLGGTILIPIYAFAGSGMVLFWTGPIVSLFLSFLGIFASYFGELYPTHIRTIGAGFCFNTGRGISAIAPFALGGIATKFGLANAIGLCGVAMFLSGIMMFFLPETTRANKK